MSTHLLHSVSVAGVAFNETGQVLLIRRTDNKQWQAPGGILERDETFEDGVVREVLEETGVTVDVERLTGCYKNVTLGVVALVYRCRVAGGRAAPSVEASEVRWVETDHVKALMTPAFAIRVLDACKPPEAGPASRAHDGTNLL